jgi:Acyltransferase family
VQSKIVHQPDEVTPSHIRYGGIDLLKHLFALAVIFQHMTSQSRYNSDVNGMIASVRSYIDEAVMGFFMISGLFFRPLPSFKAWFYKMFIRLILPFLIFSLCYTIFDAALGKDKMVTGLINTITLHGEGMQLYFLPYLLAVSSLFALLYALSMRLKIPFIIIVVVVVAACAVLAIKFPTKYSTGSDPKLFPLYALSYGLGLCFSKVLKAPISTLCVSMMSTGSFCLAIGIYDHRFFKIAALTAFLLFSILISICFPFLKRNFPGSGGVYLLHTPIVNFTISSLLLVLGISSYCNLFVSWGMTYVLCLIFTLGFIRIFPQRWILLE